MEAGEKIEWYYLWVKRGNRKGAACERSMRRVNGEMRKEKEGQDGMVKDTQTRESKRPYAKTNDRSKRGIYD